MNLPSVPFFFFFSLLFSAQLSHPSGYSEECNEEALKKKKETSDKNACVLVKVEKRKISERRCVCVCFFFFCVCDCGRRGTAIIKDQQDDES